MDGQADVLLPVHAIRWRYATVTTACGMLPIHLSSNDR